MMIFLNPCPVYNAGRLYFALTGNKHPKLIKSDNLKISQAAYNQELDNWHNEINKVIGKIEKRNKEILENAKEIFKDKKNY